MSFFMVGSTTSLLVAFFKIKSSLVSFSLYIILITVPNGSLLFPKLVYNSSKSLYFNSVNILLTFSVLKNSLKAIFFFLNSSLNILVCLFY